MNAVAQVGVGKSVAREGEPAHHVGRGKYVCLSIAWAWHALIQFIFCCFFPSASSQDEENKPVFDTTKGVVHINESDENFVSGDYAEQVVLVVASPQADGTGAKDAIDGVDVNRQQGKYHNAFIVQEGDKDSGGQFRQNEFYKELLRYGAVRSIEVNPDGRCCLYALAGVDAAQGRIIGQQWRISSADGCDQYANAFADVAQQIMLQVLQKFIDSEAVSDAFYELSQAIENGQGHEELGKRRVGVRLDCQGHSCEFSFPCDLLSEYFVTLLEEYKNMEEVRRWKEEHGANFTLKIQGYVASAINMYLEKFQSEPYCDNDYARNPWEGKVLDEVIRINRNAGKIEANEAGQLNRGVASLPEQLGRIIWEYENKCQFLCRNDMKDKDLLVSFLGQVNEAYQEQLKKMMNLYSASKISSEEQEYFQRVISQTIYDYENLLENYIQTSNGGLGSLLTQAFSTGPEQWRELLKACTRRRGEKGMFHSITELEMLILSHYLPFAVLAQSVDGSYTWRLYHQGQAHCVNSSFLGEQKELFQSCVKKGFLFQRIAGIHFDCALTTEGWEKYQHQDQGGHTSARSRV